MTPRTKTLLRIVIAVPLAALSVPAAPARAQTAEDKTAAEALFDEGKRLFLDGKLADACPRFEASERLDPGIGTLLYLADCYEGEGRLASAWATFREAAAAAKAAGQAEREAVARKRAALLEPKLYKVTLAVGGAGTPGLRVTRNDVEEKRETWGLGMPTDPGEYTLSASAPGKKPWSAKLQVPARDGAQTVTVPPLEDAPAVTPAPAGPRAAPPPLATGGFGAQRTAGIVVSAAGALGLGLGAAFGAVAMSKNASAKARCPQIQCSDALGVGLAHDAGTFADAATGAFIAGGVALVGGMVLLLAAPSDAKPRGADKAWLVPLVGGGTAGVQLGRTW